MDPIEHIVGLLTGILRDQSSRKESVKQFERYHAGLGIVTRRSIRPDVLNILDELAYDLAFYEADPAIRTQDPSYYGDERLVEEVEMTLRLLSQAQVVVPQEEQ